MAAHDQCTSDLQLSFSLTNTLLMASYYQYQFRFLCTWSDVRDLTFYASSFRRQFLLNDAIEPFLVFTVDLSQVFEVRDFINHVASVACPIDEITCWQVGTVTSTINFKEVTTA